ncbi:hypothetical protein [Puniceibacterium sp. IMCC21224]|uniref:hypothetical protein n=1 Tax=Puniceibacterium sp. IMCC21224 TaxID=1618204 RepID=UPI00065D8BE5|nr:hypothetical protein [Puniceibacterium sp. IMCC21224]KMK66763.1 hypothetical protein IMCC21224_111620 [Puniceibacterium sp. IMCC21224]
MIGILANSFMTATRQQTLPDRRNTWDAPPAWREGPSAVTRRDTDRDRADD